MLSGVVANLIQQYGNELSVLKTAVHEVTMHDCGFPDLRRVMANRRSRMEDEAAEPEQVQAVFIRLRPVQQRRTVADIKVCARIGTVPGPASCPGARYADVVSPVVVVVIRDHDGVLYKPAGSDHDGFYEPDSRASTRKHLELFEELWRYSVQDTELRTLSL